MKILIGGAPSKIFHLKEFGNALEKLNIECKIVEDVNYCDGYPSRNYIKWVNGTKRIHSLIKEFEPNLILVDRQRHFGVEASKTKIPVITHIRGDFWKEIEWAKETTYSKFPKKFVIKKWEEIAMQCFEKSDLLLPICKYLESRVREFYPDKKISIMYQGIKPSNWYDVKSMRLEHPCVGLLQGATIWGKTQELLTLRKVLEAFPKITFYWVGDGPYLSKILPILSKYENFVWLGALDYPDKVREYLSEIDVYALISGIDMSPLTLQEAQLMQKPIIATNVGGIPELMQDKKSGFLVEKGNHEQIIEYLSILINDEQKAKEMGKTGRKFVEENFNWDKIAKDFIASTRSVI
ncbi:glycosyltransferase family 4 protein [Nitrosopumilus sp.]|uniref:glycosyltransferase family 4 protein n=1 Tax=Nitrosopumilus sp. TaxID=2024843 RepID=UPI0034A05EC9